VVKSCEPGRRDGLEILRQPLLQPSTLEKEEALCRYYDVPSFKGRVGEGLFRCALRLFLHGRPSRRRRSRTALQRLATNAQSLRCDVLLPDLRRPFDRRRALAHRIILQWWRRHCSGACGSRSLHLRVYRCKRDATDHGADLYKESNSRLAGHSSDKIRFQVRRGNGGATPRMTCRLSADTKRKAQCIGRRLFVSQLRKLSCRPYASFSAPPTEQACAS